MISKKAEVLVSVTVFVVGGFPAPTAVVEVRAEVQPGDTGRVPGRERHTGVGETGSRRGEGPLRI